MAPFQTPNTPRPQGSQLRSDRDDGTVPSRPKTAIVLCQVLEREIEHFVAQSDHVVRVEKLRQGLHNEPAKLRQEVQQWIDRIEADSASGERPVEAIVLGYGLCSRGTEGVRAARSCLVLPRAHDCITLLLGSKEAYARYAAEHPGTYWYSPGWIEHHLPPGPDRAEAMFREYCDKYGEDNARFLMETEAQWHANYQRATYVDVEGIGSTEKDLAYTRNCAEWLGWEFDRQHGDAGLIRALVMGPWDEERFLVIPAGQTIRMTGDQQVIELKG